MRLTLKFYKMPVHDPIDAFTEARVTAYLTSDKVCVSFPMWDNKQAQRLTMTADEARALAAELLRAVGT